MQKKPLGFYSQNKGITLVELIVTLVILAILSAILVPALSGYIRKARTQSAIAKARSCVMAAQSIASESYGTQKPMTTENASDFYPDIQTLSEVDGEIKSMTLSVDSKIEMLIYISPEKYTVIFKEGVYTVQ